MAITMLVLPLVFYLSTLHICGCQAFVVDFKGRHERQFTAVSAALPPRHDIETAPARWIMSAALVLAIPMAAAAVSGGGLDYANLDITGQDFSNGNYKGKDFTQVIAKGTKFAGSNLQGCRFYKAYLARADFSGSDLRGASLEDTSMDDADFKNANAAGAYFGASILDVSSIENVDFSEAQLPPKILAQLCERDDAKGINPVTGADTRDSLMCP